MSATDYTNTWSWMRTSGQGLVSTSDALPSVTEAVYDRNLLERALPNLYHAYFGQQRSLKQRSGMSIVFRRYESLDQAVAPLVDGVTPPGTNLEHTDYSATLTQHGNWTVITDNVDHFHVDPVVMEATDLLGENMGESLDSVVRDILVAGTSVYRVTTDDSGTFAVGARTAVYGTLCKSVIDLALRDLEANMAKPFTPMVPGSTRVGSSPLAPAYWMLTHTKQKHDLRQVNGGFINATTLQPTGLFVPVEAYAAHVGVLKGEYGKYAEVRFVATTNLKKLLGDASTTGGTGSTMEETGSNANVYCCLLFGRDAYGVIKPDGLMGKIYQQKPGGPSDPLEQRRTVGWKAWITAKILMQSWMCRIEVATLD